MQPQHIVSFQSIIILLQSLIMTGALARAGLQTLVALHLFLGPNSLAFKLCLVVLAAVSSVPICLAPAATEDQLAQQSFAVSHSKEEVGWSLISSPVFAWQVRHGD